MYLFSTFTDTIRKPMKIGCTDGLYSHLIHAFTVSSAGDSSVLNSYNFIILYAPMILHRLP